MDRMVRVIPREIREKDVFFKFLPAHRHPISGSRTSPVEKVGIKIVPHFVHMGFTEVILKKVKRLSGIATFSPLGGINPLHLPRIDMIGLNYGASDRLTGSRSGRKTERK